MFSSSFTLSLVLAIALCRIPTSTLALPLADIGADTKVSTNFCHIANVEYADPFDALARFDRGEIRPSGYNSPEVFRTLLQYCCDALSEVPTSVLHVVSSPLPTPTLAVPTLGVVTPSVDLGDAVASLTSTTPLSLASASLTIASGRDVASILGMASITQLNAAVPTLTVEVPALDHLASASASSFYLLASPAVSVSASEATTAMIPPVISLPIPSLSVISELASPSASSTLRFGRRVTHNLAAGLDTLSAMASPFSAPTTVGVTVAEPSASTSPSSAPLTPSMVTSDAVPSVVSGFMPTASLTTTLMASSLLQSLQSTRKPAFARPTALGLVALHSSGAPVASTTTTIVRASASPSASVLVDVYAVGSSSSSIASQPLVPTLGPQSPAPQPNPHLRPASSCRCRCSLRRK